jgi:hypothetical protein
MHRRKRPPTGLGKVGKIFSRMSDTHLDAVAGSCEDLGMTDTDTPRLSTADEMLAASRRRLAANPTQVIILHAPDRSRNSQRPARRTRRTRTL